MTREREQIAHESFATIHASRVAVSGAGKRLFDSALRHGHYVEITIQRATTERGHGDSWVFGHGEELIRVGMSEAQFGQFITSMNVGSGAPCTIGRLNGQFVAEPPADGNTKETFEREVREALSGLDRKVAATLAKLDEVAGKGKPPTKADMAALRAELEAVKREVGANLPFMQQCFARTTEKVIQQAKADINGHAVLMTQQLATGAADARASLPAPSID